MNLWNRELETDLDYVWDFVDNVSTCRLIPHSSERFFLKQGQQNLSEVKNLQEFPHRDFN